MSRYPLLDVDEERVGKVGGKAAILEEILRRWPNSNVPSFQVFEDRDSLTFRWGQEKKIFRASSELDLFGGFGLHDSYTEVSLPERVVDSFEKIVNPDALNAQRIMLYAESIGKESQKPAVMSQSQRTPLYWLLVMQHPNNPDYYIISYSSSQSRETRIAGFAESFGALSPFAQVNPNFISRAQYHAVVCPSKGDIKGEIDDVVGEGAVVMGAFNHIVLQDLGIVHPDFVSIAELGVYKDRTETYQFTPVRKRYEGKSTITPDTLIFGGLEPEELPVVRVPHSFNVKGYVRNEYGLEDFPDFKEFIKPAIDQYGESMLHFGFGDFLTWNYIRDIESRYPQGYLIMAGMDAGQQFDITMQNARAVLINTGKHPASALNHNTSRLIYKAPVLVIGNIKEKLKDGQVVRFSCDGSSYSIKR